MKYFFKLILLFCMMLILPASVFSQSFGKNKVNYENFEWSLIESEHFIIHFYEGGQYIAEFAAEVMEKELATMESDFNYSIQKRIPVMIYKSHNHFQQTNIITQYLEEGIGKSSIWELHSIFNDSACGTLSRNSTIDVRPSALT